MRIYICEDCRQGFDIHISGGVNCAECGGRTWRSVKRLPSTPQGDKYRKAWAEKYQIMICDDDEDIKVRQQEWKAAGKDCPPPVIGSLSRHE